MADTVTLATFAPYVGQKFQLETSNDGPEELELMEAKVLPSRGGAPRQEPFSLLFRAPRGSGLWQGPARVAHQHVGTVEMFLVPVGKDDAGMYLEAIFN